MTLEAQPLRRLKLVSLIARGFCICLLVVPVALNLPRVIHSAHATDWSTVEDCDGNGFDDTTNIAVPWPGFDGTRGDTPAGPGTADWWIKQQAAASSGSGSSSGAGTSDTGSQDSGSSGAGTAAGISTKKSGKSASGSGSGSAAGAKTTTVLTPVAAAPVAQPASAAPVPAAVATAAPPRAPVPASAVASAATEGTGAVAVGGTSSSGGGPGANSLWAALTVGFTSQNKELLAGLGLLAALAVAGSLALGVGVVQDAGSYAQLRRNEPLGVDAAAPDIA